MRDVHVSTYATCVARRRTFVPCRLRSLRLTSLRCVSGCMQAHARTHTCMHVDMGGRTHIRTRTRTRTRRGGGTHVEGRGRHDVAPRRRGVAWRGRASHGEVVGTFRRGRRHFHRWSRRIVECDTTHLDSRALTSYLRASARARHRARFTRFPTRAYPLGYVLARANVCSYPVGYEPRVLLVECPNRGGPMLQKFEFAAFI